MLGSSEQLELFSWLKADNTNCISVHLAELLTLLYLQLVKPFYVEEQIIQLYSVTEVATFHITGSDLSLPRSDYAYLGVLGRLINCAYSAPSSPRSTLMIVNLNRLIKKERGLKYRHCQVKWGLPRSDVFSFTFNSNTPLFVRMYGRN